MAFRNPLGDPKREKLSITKGLGLLLGPDGDENPQIDESASPGLSNHCGLFKIR
jgi:hypothetical protein